MRACSAQWHETVNEITYYYGLHALIYRHFKA
jgi:hypothetical protein